MKTLLVIEDNAEIRENTCEILELAGYKAITAANGKEGIDHAIEYKPDIILCDIMMPKVNGYDVIRKLKSEPETADIPFIYVTASGEKNEVKLAMDMGAAAYVRKPFQVKELMEAIQDVINKQPPSALKYPDRDLNFMIRSLAGQKLTASLFT